MGNGIRLEKQRGAKSVYLRLYKSPGDILVLTAAVRSLKLLHPGIRVGVETTCEELWQNNPDVEPVPAYLSHIVEMHSHIYAPRRTFIEAYCSHLAGSLGIPVTPQVAAPVLCLSEEERGLRLVPDGKPYLVVMAGGKTDHTVKQQGRGFWQAVVSRLNRKFRIVQVGAAGDQHHQLKGVTSLVGKTSLRQLAALVGGSVGGIGGVTSLQHICAALGVPYVCIAGGREDAGFTDYPTQTTLSAVGSLPCCLTGGCWMSRTVPLGDGDPFDSKLCSLPVVDKWGDTVPKCLEQIEPQTVVDAVLKGVG